MMRKPMTRACTAALAIGATVAVAACGGQPTATGPTLRPAVAADQPQMATVLKRSTPLDHAVSASITVAGNGGVLRLPEAGLQVVIPRNALPHGAPGTITVTAVAGDAVAYEFQPHGLVFSAPLLATQNLAGTTWSANSGRQPLEAAYFGDASDLDVGAGTAVISDVFPTNVIATGKRLRWDIPHFSGYVIVTGRGPIGSGPGASGSAN